MNICCVMFYDDNIKLYADLNYKINKLYCEKYNLKITFSDEKKYTNRHAAWERLPLLLANISNFDYLIWIDADAFFYNDANNITDILYKNKDVNFIFSNDLGNNNVNSGFFIVKNSPYSRDFLTKWAYDDELYNSNPHPYWWDQGVLIDMFNNNILDIRQNSIQLEYGVLQHFHEHDKLPDTFVYHLAGRYNDVRYEVTKKYFDKLMLKLLVSC